MPSTSSTFTSDTSRHSDMQIRNDCPLASLGDLFSFAIFRSRRIICVYYQKSKQFQSSSSANAKGFPLDLLHSLHFFTPS